MKENKIVKLSEREHALQRPSMYIGSVKNEVSDEYVYQDGKFVVKQVSRTPGLLKIINEIIDNSIDEAIRTDFKFSNKIDIHMEEEWFSVKDNGRGIPIHDIELPDGTTMLSPEVCWTHARAGANFNENSETIGANGVGSSLTAIFSKKFIGETDDGKQVCRVVCSNNNEKVNCEIVGKSKKSGVIVKSYPDFEKLDEVHFSKDYFDLVKTRLYFLSVSYPKITFTFNDEKIQIKSKDFFGLFSDKEFVTVITDKYSIGISVSDTDDFKQFTLMNGLYLKQGGSCVDFISGSLSYRLKDKLSKKYPSLKPADIKNKMFIISVLNNFIDAKYDSQTKEKMTNSQKEVSEYFQIDLDSLANKVFKHQELIGNITDYFKIKEEFKKRQELKGLEKPQKRIKSDKYTPPIGEEKYLLLCEGYSAVSGLVSCLGRKGIGYYELKGKVMNVCGTKSISENKELSDLYKILKNSSYEKIIITSDADLDGNHITSLLINFFVHYFNDIIDKLYRLNTPIAVGITNKKMVDWCYNFKDIEQIKGHEIKYMKGLGSWTRELLDTVIKEDTLDKMMLKLDYNEERDKECVLDWFDGSSDRRKELIKESDFSLIKI